MAAEQRNPTHMGCGGFAKKGFTPNSAKLNKTQTGIVCRLLNVRMRSPIYFVSRRE